MSVKEESPSTSSEKMSEMGRLEDKPSGAAPAPPPAFTFPDGGRAAWLTVLGAFFALTASFGMLSSFGVFQTFYLTYLRQTKTPSEISWIGSLQFFIFFLCGPPIGRIFDAQGPFILLAGGTLLLPFALMMTSLCSKYWQLILAQGILVGIGSALLFYPALASVSSHFLKRRGLASGLAVTGSSVGGVIFPIVLERLFGQVGFGWSVRVSGFLTLVLGLAATVCVTSRLPKKKPGPLIDLAAFKEGKFAIFALGSFIMAFGLFVPYYYIEAFALSQGVSPRLAFYTVSVMNAGSIFGRLLSAPLMDSLGKFNVFIPATCSAGIVCLAIWLPSSAASASTVLAPILVFAVAFGAFSGAFMACAAPSIAAISPITSIGVRIGTLYSVLSIPVLVSNPISGAFLNDGGSTRTFHHLIIWAGVTQVVGALVCLGTRFLINPRIMAKV